MEDGDTVLLPHSVPAEIREEILAREPDLKVSIAGPLSEAVGTVPEADAILTYTLRRNCCRRHPVSSGCRR